MESLAVPLGETHPTRQLYDYDHRFMSPLLSRWLQRDPAGYVDGMNLYEFLGSNPMRYVDSRGTVIEELFNLYYHRVYASNDEIQTVMSMGLEPSEASGGELRMLRNAGEALFGFTPTGAAMGYTVNPVNVAVESGRIVGGAYTGAVDSSTSAIFNFQQSQRQSGHQTSLAEDAAYGTLHNLGLLGLAEGPANVDLQSNATLSDQPVDFLLFTGNERFRRTTEGVGMAAILLSGFAPQEQGAAAVANTQRTNLLRNLEASQAVRAASRFEVYAAKEAKIISNIGRLDYSADFAADLTNFNSGYKHFAGTLQNDIMVVQYHRIDRLLGEGRSAKWWTTTNQANQLQTMEDVRNILAMPADWGPRNAVSVAKIPKGTEVEFYMGTARWQTGSNGIMYPGSGMQFRFKNFDPRWIVGTRRIPGVN